MKKNDRKNDNKALWEESSGKEFSPVEFALLTLVIGLIASGVIEGLKYREPLPIAGLHNPTFVEMHAWDEKEKPGVPQEATPEAPR